LRRSNEPPFWALFGAGGMLAALLGPALVAVTGLLVPLGVVLPTDTLRPERVLAFVRHPLGALATFAVIALFLWHGCHRLLHSLHDLGLPAGRAARIGFYGFAVVGSLATATLLVALRG
jgi:fumarate reductase subunit D